MTHRLLTRRAVLGTALAAPALISARAASGWTREAYEKAMIASGRPVSLTQAQFDAIQARKPAAMKRIESYLKERLGHADPAVMAAFEELPRELEESAWVDGASRFAAFRLVVLPLVRPGLVAATILALLLAWNDFIFAAVLTTDATRTLPVLMASFSGDVGVDWGAMTASCVLVVLPVLLFSFAAQRHLVAGLSSGAVKG